MYDCVCVCVCVCVYTMCTRYHDMDGVLDFMVLEGVYTQSIEREWEEGSKFQSLIDGHYWYGKVVEKREFCQEVVDSHWQCYSVLWDDGATDQLSPWDMEVIGQGGLAYPSLPLPSPQSLLLSLPHF